MAINELPREVLENVLLKLDPLDLLNSAMVCRRWEETISSSTSLLRDTWLELRGGTCEKVLPMVLKSPRHHQNLRILGADLTLLNSELWTKYGKHLRRLELVNCKLTHEVLCSSLQLCSELESLKISGFWQEFENFPADIVVPAGGTGLDKVSLCNLQHLHLELGSSAKLLNALLEVIPNATSLRLSATADDFNIGEVVSALRSKPLMLTKLDCEFKGFNFRAGDHLRPLLKMYSGGLQVLKLDCRDMSHKTFMALSKCSKLQHLTLSNASVFGNDHLEKLVRNVPDLETLHIYGYNRLTGAGLKCIQDLRKLRSLHIEGNAIPNGALSGLGEISTLRDLSLTVSKTDIGIIQTVARLPVLRSLGLHVPNSGILEDPTGTSTIGSGLLQHIACLNGLRILALNVALGSEDFSVICENFPMLEKLALRDCSKLSDADGMKLRLLKHLKSIRMELCLGFNDLTFERGLGSSALEEIDLSSCNVTDAGLASIAAHHGRLRSLSFFHCAAITDTGVASLVEREPYLRYLGLPLCAGLSSRILSLLEPVCPRLRVLIIGGRFIEADSETAERIGRTTHCVIW